MPIRFEAYRMRDGVTPLAEDYFNGVLGDIDARIAELEERRADWQTVLNEVTKFGLARVDDLIGPRMDEVNAMLAELRQRRDELVAAVGNVGDLATQTQLATAIQTEQEARDGAISVLAQATNAAITAEAQARTQAVQAIAGTLDSLKSVGGVALQGAGNVPVQLIETAANVIAANTTAAAGRTYDCDTSAGAFTLTLPAAPAIGARVGVRDYKRSFGKNNLTLARNAQLIEGLTESCVIDRPLRCVLEFRGGSQGWLFI